MCPAIHFLIQKIKVFSMVSDFFNIFSGRNGFCCCFRGKLTCTECKETIKSMPMHNMLFNKNVYEKYVEMFPVGRFLSFSSF